MIAKDCNLWSFWQGITSFTGRFIIPGVVSKSYHRIHSLAGSSLAAYTTIAISRDKDRFPWLSLILAHCGISIQQVHTIWSFRRFSYFFRLLDDSTSICLLLITHGNILPEKYEGMLGAPDDLTPDSQSSETPSIDFDLCRCSHDVQIHKQNMHNDMRKYQ